MEYIAHSINLFVIIYVSFNLFQLNPSIKKYIQRINTKSYYTLTSLAEASDKEILNSFKKIFILFGITFLSITILEVQIVNHDKTNSILGLITLCCFYLFVSLNSWDNKNELLITLINDLKNGFISVTKVAIFISIAITILYFLFNPESTIQQFLNYESIYLISHPLISLLLIGYILVFFNSSIVSLVLLSPTVILFIYILNSVHILLDLV